MSQTKPQKTPPATPFQPFEILPGDPGQRLILLCDHACNRLPPEYGDLGLGPESFERHIAYDIGAEAVTRRLAELTGAPAALAGFSRLLIDPNRGAQDPTLVMRLSDRRLIPGNARIDAAEIERRRALYWQPYRAAIAETIAALMATGPNPAVVCLHTFTPNWRGTERPWQIGILWDADPRLPLPLIAALKDRGLIVGDNEPYDGALPGDTLHEQVTSRGLAGLLIEVRQDLVATPEKAYGWADLLAEVLAPILARPEMHEIVFGPSRAGHCGQ